MKKIYTALFINLAFSLSVNAMKAASPAEPSIHESILIKTTRGELSDILDPTVPNPREGVDYKKKKATLGMWYEDRGGFRRDPERREEMMKTVLDRAVKVINFYESAESNKIESIERFEGIGNNYYLIAKGKRKNGTYCFIKLSSNQYKNSLGLYEQEKVERPIASSKIINDMIPGDVFVRWEKLIEFSDGVIEVQPLLKKHQTHFEYYGSATRFDSALMTLAMRGSCIGKTISAGVFTKDPHLDNAVVMESPTGDIEYKLIDNALCVAVEKGADGRWLGIDSFIIKQKRDGGIKKLLSNVGVSCGGGICFRTENPEGFLVGEIAQNIFRMNPLKFIHSAADIEKVAKASKRFLANLFSKIDVTEKNKIFWKHFFEMNKIQLEKTISVLEKSISESGHGELVTDSAESLWDSFKSSVLEKKAKSVFKPGFRGMKAPVRDAWKDDAVLVHCLKGMRSDLDKIVASFSEEDQPTWCCGLFGGGKPDVYGEISKTKASLLAGSL